MTQINKRRIAKNVIFLYAKVIINMVVTLYATRVVLKVLGTSDYGVYGVVAGAVAMLASLNGAMAQTTQRFMSYAEGANDKEKLQSYFNSSIIIHLVLGVVVMLLMEAFYYPMFNGIFNIPYDRVSSAKLVYHFIVISTVFTIFTVPYDATINAHEDLVYYSIVGVIDALLRLGAAFLLFIIGGDKLIWYGLLLALITILMMAIMRIYCIRHYEECRFSPKKFKNNATLIEMGKFAGWNFVGTFSGIAGNHGTSLVMNHYFGVIVTAAISISDQVGSAIGAFSTNMLKAFNPVIVKSEGSGDRNSMLNISMISCRYAFFMFALISVPFFIEADFVLKVWLLEIPKWTVLFCQLQILRLLLEQMVLPIGTSLMAEGHIKKMNVAGLSLSVISLIIHIIVFSYDFQPWWHFVISIFFMVILNYSFKIYYCKKYCGLEYHIFFKGVFFRCILCLIGQLLTGYFILISFNAGWLRLFYMVVCTSVSLLILIYIFGMRNSERIVLHSVMKNRILNKLKK